MEGLCFFYSSRPRDRGLVRDCPKVEPQADSHSQRGHGTCGSSFQPAQTACRLFVPEGMQQGDATFKRLLHTRVRTRLENCTAPVVPLSFPRDDALSANAEETNGQQNRDQPDKKCFWEPPAEKRVVECKQRVNAGRNLRSTTTKYDLKTHDFHFDLCIRGCSS